MEDLKSSLLREYNFWKTSNNILNEMTSILDTNEAKVRMGMENSLMQQMLQKVNEPVLLFKNLTEQQLEFGFAEADISPNEGQVKKVMAVIAREVQAFYDQPAGEMPGEIKINDDYFQLGDYKIERIAPVERAFNTLNAYNNEEAAAILLRSAIRYASIYSETRHIGPPQIVYDHFYDWGVRNEGFASPFNARVMGKPDAQFYSLFKETDAPMGSGGSFFELEKPENPGHWCLDPPFITETMDRVDGCIAEWRKQFPSVAILLVIPSWHTPANTPDETVELLADKHYYEGLDHSLHPLPVNVSVHRYGDMPGFSAEAIVEGYSPAEVDAG